MEHLLPGPAVGPAFSWEEACACLAPADAALRGLEELPAEGSEAAAALLLAPPDGAKSVL